MSYSLIDIQRFGRDRDYVKIMRDGRSSLHTFRKA